MFFLWIVSYPGHDTRIARGLGWYNYWQCLLSLFLSSSIWCHKSNLGHGTRIARGLGTIIISMSLCLYLVSPLVLQEILVMAPELQEDLLGTKVKKVLLSLIQNKEPGAMRDVTAPELQEVSLYQFI